MVKPSDRKRIASHLIDKWREHYNHVRPHSSLNYLSPVEFAKRAA
ncbi:integrase core domain-containing protein [Thalassotalea euphylliae]|uniref:Integrase catalytic domain-containing protein n=1 Tax=Thalassotalea euphylliae TaxID=1655234 RepID=A0A3E0TJ17_9GAMM|nr:hypothetical protein DXX94_19090 [Thalassotalea euphylliae]REL29242.1 hypothetical protein DXX94_00015 [Thalassotalea euphylliae]